MMAPRAQPAPESSPRASGIVVPIGVAGDDSGLVAALREDRPGAKAAFFQSYALYVERLVTHLIGFDRDLADIVQNVFMNALGALHALEDARALKPWLARVTINTTLKVLRSRSRRGWLRLFRDSEDELRRQEPAPDLDQERPARAPWGVRRAPASSGRRKRRLRTALRRGHGSYRGRGGLRRLACDHQASHRAGGDPLRRGRAQAAGARRMVEGRHAMAEPMTDLDELGRGVSEALDGYRVEREKAVEAARRGFLAAATGAPSRHGSRTHIAWLAAALVLLAVGAGAIFRALPDR